MKTQEKYLTKEEMLAWACWKEISHPQRLYWKHIRFTTKNIPEILKLANQLAALETAEFEFEIYAVPDGEGDYDFTSVAIEATGAKVQDSYCRF